MDKIKALQKHAEDNYDNGYDTFVECWEEDDYSRILKQNGNSIPRTKKFMAKLVDGWWEIGGGGSEF